MSVSPEKVLDSMLEDLSLDDWIHDVVVFVMTAAERDLSQTARRLHHIAYLVNAWARQEEGVSPDDLSCAPWNDLADTDSTTWSGVHIFQAGGNTGADRDANGDPVIEGAWYVSDRVGDADYVASGPHWSVEEAAQVALRHYVRTQAPALAVKAAQEREDRRPGGPAVIR